MAAATVGVAGLLIFIEGQLSGVGGVVASRLSVHASMLSTLLLALSAVLYLAHALVRDARVDRVASALAAAGASGIIGASLVRWVEVEWMAPGALHYAGQYELLTWSAAIAVYLYLCVEDVYQTPLAGGFVLPSVVAALGLAAWLIAVSPAPEQTFMALAASYIGCAVHVSAAIGAIALATTAGLGVAGAVRPRAALASPAVWRWSVSSVLPGHDRALRWALLVGFCAFALAAMLGAARQLLTRMPALDLGVPALWLDGAALLLAWALRRTPRDLASWWSLIAIVLVGVGAVVADAVPLAVRTGP